MDSRRIFLLRAWALLAGVGAFGRSLRAWGQVGQNAGTGAIGNPYAGIPSGAGWLKGEVHTHIAHDARDAMKAAIYAAAKAEALDFVAMSVEATERNGGAEHFPEVRLGNTHGVTGIPAREIQNNLFGPRPYFQEHGAEFLHVLTVGRPGVSICAHPRFYDMVGGERGSWDGIRSALLRPRAGDRLEGLAVSGIEIFNGYTLSVLRSRGREQIYRDYDERCWDDLLSVGKLCWGFAGNDAFVDGHDYDRFIPLGCVHVAASSNTQEDIVSALQQGRFYSSTGVRLSERPITVTAAEDKIRISAEATEPVDWTARVHRRNGQAWELATMDAPNRRRADFEIRNEWKYVRVQCRRRGDPWQRAWLQPIVNARYFAVQ